jgi:hypothetical protein
LVIVEIRILECPFLIAAARRAAWGSLQDAI